MRKLIVMMAALLLAGTAAADDQKLGSTGQETKEAGQAASRDAKAGADKMGDQTRATANDARERTGDAMRDQNTGADTTRDAQASHDQARDQMKKDSFDIKGKVSKVSPNSLTLHRDDATAATLHTDANTKVEVDGNTARLSQLKSGQDVKASFNLKGDKPMAIEIKASK